MLAEKYRPEKLSDVVGYKGQIELLKAWMKSWCEGRPIQKGALIYGKPGLGKTSTAIALANDFSLPYLLFDASDKRYEKGLSEVLKFALTQHVFSESGKKVIIFDEVDNMTKEGYKVLKLLLKHTNHPLIFIANVYKKIPPALRSKTMSIKYGTLSRKSCYEFLYKIINLEGIEIDAEALSKIVNNNETLRGQLNALDTYTLGGRTVTQKNMYELLKCVIDTSISADEIGNDLDNVFAWLAENANNYDDIIKLSKIDRWRRNKSNIALISKILLHNKYSIQKIKYPKKFIYLHKSKKVRRKLWSEAKDMHTKLHNSKRGYIVEDKPVVNLLTSHDDYSVEKAEEQKQKSLEKWI